MIAFDSHDPTGSLGNVLYKLSGCDASKVKAFACSKKCTFLLMKNENDDSCTQEESKANKDEGLLHYIWDGNHWVKLGLSQYNE